MEKLTYYDKWLKKYIPHKTVENGEIYAKLGRLEELQAAGRLVILPEGYCIKDLAYCASVSHCPADLGLPKTSNCASIACEDCWEAALKG